MEVEEDERGPLRGDRARASVDRRRPPAPGMLELEVHPADHPERRIVLDDEDGGSRGIHGGDGTRLTRR